MDPRTSPEFTGPGKSDAATGNAADELARLKTERSRIDAEIKRLRDDKRKPPQRRIIPAAAADSAPVVKWVSYGALAILLGFLFLVNALWIKIDDRPPRWDESANLAFAERGLHLIQQGQVFAAFDSGGSLRPNFVPVMQSLTFPILGHSTKHAIFLLSSVALTIISLALFDLGRRLYGPGTGLLAVVLFNTFPSVSLWSRYYNLDLPLTAFVTVTVWAAYRLWESQFEDRRFAVALGVTVAMGICAKHMYAPLVALPLLWLVFLHWRSENYSLRAMLDRNPVLYGMFVLAGIIGALFHVVLNYEMFREGVMRSFFTERSSLADAGYIPPSLIAKLAMFDYQLDRAGDGALTRYVYYALIAAGALTSLLWWRRGMGFVLAWIAGTFLLFVVAIRVTVPYYYIPVLPAVALVAAAATTTLLPRLLKPLGRWAAGAAVAASLAVGGYFLTIHLERSLGTVSPLKIFHLAPGVFAATVPKENPYAATRYWDVRYVDGNVGTLPYPHYWPVPEMLGAVAAERARLNVLRPVRLGLLTNYEWMSGDQFNYRIWQAGLQDRITLIQPLPSQVGQQPEKFIAPYDFVAFKTGQIFKRDFYGLPWADQSQALVDSLVADDFGVLRRAGFSPVFQAGLPDGSTGWVWRSDRATDVSLIDELGRARRSIPDQRYALVSAFSINGDLRPVLYHHPVPLPGVNELTWPETRITAGALLEFGIAIAPGVWSEKNSDGVEFRIDLTADDGTRERIFRSFINPAHVEADRRWHDHRLDLSRFGGRTVDLHFSVRPGPAGNTAFDQAGWSGLRIAPLPNGDSRQ